MTMNRREILNAVAIGVPAMTLAAAVEEKALAAPKGATVPGGAPAFAGQHLPQAAAPLRR
jgi:hypothetical protein